MWLLKNNNGKIRYLKPNKTITIGRKQADIVLENDSSISRVHASIVIMLKDQIRTTDISSTCIIKDTSSKYGTFVIRNGIQTRVSSEGFELQSSDTLKFGLQQHTFLVEYIHLVTLISRLSIDHKKKLQEIMNSIGGIIVDFYDDNCTHLTATTATSTNKIISALIAGIPIIDINYWLSVEKAIETNDNFPDPNLFTLPLQDKGINTQRVSLKPNSARKTLFQEKTFIFFSDKMYEEYKKIIKSAGGKIELRFKQLIISEDLFKDGNIVMQITNDSITDELNKFNAILSNKMHEKNLRMIAETEIPLAIVYVSLSQYCNPKYHFKNLMQRKNLIKDTSKILALDTQDILISKPIDVNPNKSTLNSKQLYIPETNNFSQEFSQSKNIQINLQNKECILKSSIEQKNVEVLIQEVIHDNLNKEQMLHKNETQSKNNQFIHLEQKKQNIELINLEKNKSDLKLITSEKFDIIDNQNSNFIQTQLKASEDYDNKGKKRCREKSDPNDMNRNVKPNWRNKKRISLCEPHKKIKNLTTVIEKNDDFADLEKQFPTKEKKQNKLDEWGFKTSVKKTIDFDLDDIDMEELKTETKADTLKNKKDTKNFLDLQKSNIVGVEVIKEKNSKETKEPCKENAKSKKFIEFIDLKDDCENKIEIKHDIKKSHSIQSNIKLQLNINNKKNKIFKKVYNQIPVKRIALSNMSIWKSN